MLNWKLVLVRLELVRVLTQDRCMVCAERTIGLEIDCMQPMELLSDVGHAESRSVRLEMVLVLLFVLVQDRCTVYNKCTIGSYIILDAPDGS